MTKLAKKVIGGLMAAILVMGQALGVPGSSDATNNKTEYMKLAEVEAAGNTPVANHGKLSVKGTDLVDQYGEKFQIRGVSTHGLQWYSQYNNQATYQTLRDDWGANCIRLAMYTAENGYINNKTSMKQQVMNGVEYATNLGMYAIIDWHILSDGNPQTYKSEAKTFFEEMAKKYKDNNNVLYEICNEPNGCSWGDIKSYAEEIIPIIKKYNKDAIIIVGTPTWSQLGSQGHLYEPMDNPIKGYSNIMYTFHFYASDPNHNQWLTKKIQTAVNGGLPVFVTEFGLSAADGNGNIDTNKATEWLKRCDDYNVSYCVWSLSNDWRSSSLIKNSCSKTSGWSTSDLTTAGNFIRNWYISKKEAENPLINNPEVPMEPGITVSYTTHVQSFGWLDYVNNGKMSGKTGLGKRLEGIKINVKCSDPSVDLGIRYKTHVQTYGWQDWRYDDAMSGTTGEAKRLEAICIELTGKDKDKYDVYYRVHAQTYGWLGWTKNGMAAGTEGYAKRLEAINIFIVKKGADPGVSTSNSFVTPYPGNVNYSTHVQSFGWQDFVYDKAPSGTSGLGKRLEGIKIKLNRNIDGGITYTTHVQTYGWQPWVKDGAVSGTTGQAKRLEAIRIDLTGNAKNEYDVYYRVHIQTKGWLGWAKNGEESGSSGMGKRLEAIQIVLVKKGEAAPGSTDNCYLTPETWNNY